VEPTDGQNAGNLREKQAETVMLRQPPRITSDSTNAPACSQIGDWHDLIGHHRYYGSSAIDGERIAEIRSGARPRSLNACGF